MHIYRCFSWMTWSACGHVQIANVIYISFTHILQFDQTSSERRLWHDFNYECHAQNRYSIVLFLFLFSFFFTQNSYHCLTFPRVTYDSQSVCMWVIIFFVWFSLNFSDKLQWNFYYLVFSVCKYSTNICINLLIVNLVIIT